MSVGPPVRTIFIGWEKFAVTESTYILVFVEGLGGGGGYILAPE